MVSLPEGATIFTTLAKPLAPDKTVTGRLMRTHLVMSGIEVVGCQLVVAQLVATVSQTLLLFCTVITPVVVQPLLKEASAEIFQEAMVSSCVWVGLKQTELVGVPLI